MPQIDKDRQLNGFNNHKADRGFTFNLLQAGIYLYILEDLITEHIDNGRVMISFSEMRERTQQETLRYYLECSLISKLMIIGEPGKQTALFKLTMLR